MGFRAEKTMFTCDVLKAGVTSASSRRHRRRFHETPEASDALKLHQAAVGFRTRVPRVWRGRLRRRRRRRGVITPVQNFICHKFWHNRGCGCGGFKSEMEEEEKKRERKEKATFNHKFCLRSVHSRQLFQVLGKVGPF